MHKAHNNSNHRRDDAADRRSSQQALATDNHVDDQQVLLAPVSLSSSGHSTADQHINNHYNYTQAYYRDVDYGYDSRCPYDLTGHRLDLLNWWSLPNESFYHRQQDYPIALNPLVGPSQIKSFPYHYYEPVPSNTFGDNQTAMLMDLTCNPTWFHQPNHSSKHDFTPRQEYNEIASDNSLESKHIYPTGQFFDDSSSNQYHSFTPFASMQPMTSQASILSVSMDSSSNSYHQDDQLSRQQFEFQEQSPFAYTYPVTTQPVSDMSFSYAETKVSNRSQLKPNKLKTVKIHSEKESISCGSSTSTTDQNTKIIYSLDSSISSAMLRSSYMCRKCRAHGKMLPVKQHKRNCPFKSCTCPVCSLVNYGRKIVARQIALYRDQKNHTITNVPGQDKRDSTLRRPVREQHRSLLPNKSSLTLPTNPNFPDEGPHCRRCRNHGEQNPWKGHKKTCPYRCCMCQQCILISLRKSNEKNLREVVQDFSEDSISMGKRQTQTCKVKTARAVAKSIRDKMYKLDQRGNTSFVPTNSLNYKNRQKFYSPSNVDQIDWWTSHSKSFDCNVSSSIDVTATAGHDAPVLELKSSSRPSAFVSNCPSKLRGDNAGASIDYLSDLTRQSTSSPLDQLRLNSALNLVTTSCTVDSTVHNDVIHSFIPSSITATLIPTVTESDQDHGIGENLILHSPSSFAGIHTDRQQLITTNNNIHFKQEPIALNTPYFTHMVQSSGLDGSTDSSKSNNDSLQNTWSINSDMRWTKTNTFRSYSVDDSSNNYTNSLPTNTANPSTNTTIHKISDPTTCSQHCEHESSQADHVPVPSLDLTSRQPMIVDNSSEHPCSDGAGKMLTTITEAPCRQKQIDCNNQDDQYNCIQQMSANAMLTNAHLSALQQNASQDNISAVSRSSSDIIPISTLELNQYTSSMFASTLQPDPAHSIGNYDSAELTTSPLVGSVTSKWFDLSQPAIADSGYRWLVNMSQCKLVTQRPSILLLPELSNLSHSFEHESEAGTGSTSKNGSLTSNSSNSSSLLMSGLNLSDDCHKLCSEIECKLNKNEPPIDCQTKETHEALRMLAEKVQSRWINTP